MTTPFPAVLGFNVQTQNPFTNERFYARSATGGTDGTQSFTISNAVGDPVSTVSFSIGLEFDDVVKQLRWAVTALRERTPS